MTSKPNKHLTKYLQESRKVWSNGEARKQKGLPRHVKVVDIYENDEHVKSMVIDTKTNEAIQELSPALMSALLQLDFIRLQNELDQIEKDLNETRKPKIWKAFKYLLIFVMVYMISCRHVQDDASDQLYEITCIELVDSTVYGNTLDNLLGIPTKIRTHYKYQVTLMNDSVIKTLAITANSRINPDDFLGEHVKVVDGNMYYP